MDVFACTGCGTELTAPVSRVVLPVHTHHGGWEELHPPLMEPTTYAVDPRPTGPPWRSWEEVGQDAAARQGVHTPVHAVSFDAASANIRVPPLITRAVGSLIMRIPRPTWPTSHRLVAAVVLAAVFAAGWYLGQPVLPSRARHRQHLCGTATTWQPTDSAAVTVGRAS